MAGCVAIPSSGRCQQAPFHLTGDVVTGYASTSVEDGVNRSGQASVFNLNLNLTGYLGHPDFLNFEVKPQVSFGGDAPQARIGGRDGISFRARLLRRRFFPITFSYSKYSDDSLVLYSARGLTGFRQKSRNEELALRAELNLPRLPNFSFLYSQNNGSSRPTLNVLPSVESDDKKYGVWTSHQLRGWRLSGDVQRELRSRRSQSTLLPDLITSTFSTNETRANAYASRTFWKQSSVSMAAGSRSGRNVIRGFSLTTDSLYGVASSSLKLSPRWVVQLSAGYNSFGNTLPSERLFTFLPEESSQLLETTLSNLRFTSRTSFKLNRNWSFSGGFQHARLRNSRILTLPERTTAWSGEGGASYQKRFPWGKLQGSYGLSASRSSRLGNGLGAESLGHNFSVRLQSGDLRRLEVTADANGTFSSTESNLLVRTRAIAAEIGLGRRVKPFIFRGKMGFRRNQHKTLQRFSSNEWDLEFEVEHERFNARYGRRALDGRTLIFALLAPTDPDPGRLTLPDLPLSSILSATSVQRINLLVRPRSRLQGRLNWYRLKQDIDGRVNNNLNYLELALFYRFRQLTIEIGYTHSGQAIRENARGKGRTFFFRVTRPFVVF